MDVLFIGDPWNTLDHPRDSTLHLTRVAAARHGARSFWAVPESIFLQNGAFHVMVEGEVVDGALKPGRSTREFCTFHSAHWRADPPVTLSTMRLWSLLASSGGQKGVPFVNAPQALLSWNEKFAPIRFRDWAIPSFVGDSPAAWRAFFGSASARGAQLVAKPAGDAASRGVRLLSPSWEDAERELAGMRAEYGAWLILQEFDRALLNVGETRVFTLGPAVCGAINKRPHPKHLIMNLDAPDGERPTLALAEPSPEQHRRSLEVARALAAEGVYLATIDFIGDRILEINVTSPGLIQWIDERLETGRRIAERYWDGLLRS